VAPNNASIFAAMTGTIVLNAQRATDMMLDRIVSRLGSVAEAPIAAGAARPTAFQIAQTGTNVAALGALAPALPPLDDGIWRLVPRRRIF